MYKFYPDDTTTTADLVVSAGNMRVRFVMKSTTSFSKLSLSDPTSTESYYIGSVGDGTAYCIPLTNLSDTLYIYFLKSDGETWTNPVSFTFDADSLTRVSGDTSGYPLSEQT